MPAPFPHHYQATVQRIAPARARLEADTRPALTGGPPPEFGGDNVAWTPEHLLLQSIALCLFTTYEAYAARERVEVSAWSARAAAVVDKTPAGLAFTSFVVEVNVTAAPADHERVRALVDKAHRLCMVSNALRVPVDMHVHIAAAPDVAA